MDLKETKKKIKIVSPDEKLNAKVLDLLGQEHDCFGVDYGEDHDECKKCTIFAELGDRRATLWEFCKELTGKHGVTVTSVKEGNDEMTKEEKSKGGEDMEEEEKVDEKKEEKQEKKEKKVKVEKAEKVPFREGSARLFAYNKLKEGMKEEELLTLICKDFKMKESNARAKIKTAKKALE